MKILILGGLGYIGSSLYQYLLEKGYSVYSTDIEMFPSECYLPNHRAHLGDLTSDFLREFDTFIFLAGFSSAYYCQSNPESSWRINFNEFVNITNRLPPGSLFIYASSASVYGTSPFVKSKESDFLNTPISEYDKQKQALDHFMSNKDLNYFGLRFGTVCGFSATPRNELVVNAMVRSAIMGGIVKANNKNSFRSILGMSDLHRAIEAILSNPTSPGIYNLASLDSTIGNLGIEISKLFNAKLDLSLEGNSLYSFTVDTKKFQETFNFQFTETLESIAEQCRKNNFDINR